MGLFGEVSGSFFRLEDNMEVIQKINNNAAVCIDGSGNELVAIGTGIGFPKVPYTLEDLSKVQKTYYGIDSQYLELLNQIPTEYFDISSEITEIYRNTIDNKISSNIIFTLADHIYFSVKRFKNNIKIENPLHYEIQHLYELEFDVGLKGLDIINERTGYILPKAEASIIALHFINAEIEDVKEVNTFNFEDIIGNITDIIAEHFQIYINKNNVSYSRFVSHFQYLLKRDQDRESMNTNSKLYDNLVKEYPESYNCVLKIKKYLEGKQIIQVDKSEMFYLILHVNRLRVREEL